MAENINTAHKTSAKLNKTADELNDFLGNKGIKENNIDDDAVTSDKIAANAVSGSQILNGSITEGKIADNAVTPGKLSQNYLPTSGGTMTGTLTLSGNDAIIKSDGVNGKVVIQVDDFSKARIRQGNSGDGAQIATTNMAQTLANTARDNAQTYADTKIAQLINGAPATMDTLKELSDAIDDNTDVIDALNSAITNKMNKTDIIGSSNIADRAVTFAKLGSDVNAAISHLQHIVDKEYNLSSLTNASISGAYTASNLPLNKFVKIINDTSSDLTFFQDGDDYGTSLSSSIPSYSSRILIKIKEPVDGAEPSNGYCLVIDNIATKQDIGNLITRINGLSTVATTGNYNDLMNKPSIPDIATVNTKQNEWIATTTGNGGAYAVTLSPAPTTLYVGMKITIIPHTANTTVSPTLTVNNFGSQRIVRRYSGYTFTGTTTDLGAIGAYQANKPVTLIFDGSKWIDMVSTKPKWDDIDGKPSFHAVATSGNYNDLSNKPDLSRLCQFADLEFTATEEYRDIDGNVTIGSRGEFLKFDSVLKVLNQADASIRGIVFNPCPNILIIFNFTNSIPVGGVGYFYISPSMLTFSEAVMAYTGNGNLEKTIENCSWVVA